MKESMASIGPCAIPNYGAKSWTKMQLPKGMQMHEVWRLVGPMVDRNITRRPIWEVFCMVYLEALQHGSQAVADLAKDAQGKPFEITHGIDCIKAPHTGVGYLHGHDDDEPYDVDGVKYCGRCHWSLQP